MTAKIPLSHQRRLVWKGELKQTSTGMTKKDLALNKAGKVVSKKAQAAARKNWLKSGKKRLEEHQY